MNAIHHEREEMYAELGKRDGLVSQLESDLMHERSEKELYRNILMTRLGLIPSEGIHQADKAPSEVAPRSMPRKKTIAQILHEMEMDHRRKAAERDKKVDTNVEAVNT